MDDTPAAGDRFADPARIPYVAVLASRTPEVQPDDLTPTRLQGRPQSAADQSLESGNQNAVAHARSRNMRRSRGGNTPGYRLKTLTFPRFGRSSTPGAIRANRQSSRLIVLVVVGIELIGAIVVRRSGSLCALGSPESTGSEFGLAHRTVSPIAGPAVTIVPSAGCPEVAWRNGVRLQTRSRPTRVSGSFPTLPYLPNRSRLPPLPVDRHPFADVKGG